MAEVQTISRPKRDETVVINDDFDVPSLLHPLTGKIFVTNRVGARVMALADGSRTLDEISGEIAAHFRGAEPAVIHAEVIAFLEDSAAKGLISWS